MNIQEIARQVFPSSLIEIKDLEFQGQRDIYFHVVVNSLTLITINKYFHLNNQSIPNLSIGLYKWNTKNLEESKHKNIYHGFYPVYKGELDDEFVIRLLTNWQNFTL
jgi:hypothetical protein